MYHAHFYNRPFILLLSESVFCYDMSNISLVLLTKLPVIWAMPTNSINLLQLEFACIMLKISKTYPAD